MAAEADDVDLVCQANRAHRRGRRPNGRRLRLRTAATTPQFLADCRSFRLRPGQALGGELELFSRNSAQLEKSEQSLFDQIIGAGSAGGDADDGGTFRQPIFRYDFLFLVQVVMFYFVA